MQAPLLYQIKQIISSKSDSDTQKALSIFRIIKEVKDDEFDIGYEEGVQNAKAFILKEGKNLVKEAQAVILNG